MISNGVKKLLWKVCLLKDAVLKKRLYTELKNIANSLEQDIFPKLVEKEIMQASVEITESGLRVNPLAITISISPDVTTFFQELGISEIEMDSILESNQIMDIFRDVYALKTTSPLLIDGYKAYCAITKFSPDSKCLSIRYLYCELDYSKAIRGIKERSRVKDHRIFFQKAPFYGAVSGFLAIAMGILYPYLPAWLHILLSIVIGIAIGIIVFFVFQVLGSLEYDKEYLEKRLKEKR